MPIYLADQLGYFTELGLNVTQKIYPSGAPQIKDASENAAWDIGAAGSVPCILGGLLDPQIQTIGISNDESAANALVGNAEGVAMYEMLDLSTQNVTIAITPNSTGQYVVEACLEDHGQDDSWFSNAFTFAQQSGVQDLMKDGEASYGSLWAPYTYTFTESVNGSAVLCTGKDAGAPVPGGIMLRKEFGDENPDTVALVLAAWMRSIGYMLNEDNREEAISYLRELYAANGVVISDDALAKEFETRPVYGLDEQLEIFDSGTLGEMFTDVATFMARKGVIGGVPPDDTYMTSKYMEMVKENATLNAFAKMDEGGSGMKSDASLTKIKFVISFFGIVAWTLL